MDIPFRTPMPKRAYSGSEGLNQDVEHKPRMQEAGVPDTELGRVSAKYLNETRLWSGGIGTNMTTLRPLLSIR